MTGPQAGISIPGLDEHGKWLARISTRSALLADVSHLLSAYLRDGTDFRTLIIETNITLRKNSSARAKLFQELKGRYILDESQPLFDLFLSDWKEARDEIERLQIIYILFCLNDRTVFSISAEWLFPRLRSAPSALSVPDLLAFLQSQSNEHPEIAAWSEKTSERVAQHYLASVRDFGFATGKNRKQTVRPVPSAGAIRFLLRCLKKSGITIRDIVQHKGFRVLGIHENEVIDHLYSLNRDGYIRFRMQGDVIEIGV